MADIQDILNERFATNTETTVDTATTETTQPENTATEVVETPVVVNEEVVSDSSLTEVTEEVTTEAATPALEEVTTEVKNDSDINALFQKLGVKSVDEISERLTRLQSLEESKTLGKLIDDLSAKGIDPITAVTFHKLDVNALSPKEKIAWNTKMQHPNLSDEQISALIDQEYGDETDLAKQAKLIIAGDAAGKELEAKKVKILAPTTANKEIEAKQLEAQAAETKRVNDWKATPKVKEILSTLGKIEQKVSFSTFGEDKPVNKSFNFSYQIPKDGLADVENALRNIGIAQGLDPNAPESAATLKQAAENLYWIQNKDKVLASLANTVASHLHKEAALKFHNSNPDRSGGGFIDTGKKSIADQRLEATIKSL